MPKPTDSKSQPTSQCSDTRSDESQVTQLQSEIAALRHRLAEQTAEIARLRDLTQTDEVTGVGNRRSFETEIKRRHAELKRNQRPYCLLVIDVDDFKSINDQFGHVIGDQWLQAIARFLVNQVRTSDVVARLGGDEFAIILPGTKQHQAKRVVERLVDEVVLAVGDSDRDAPVSLSIGLIEAACSMSVQQAIELADRAMYQAKKQGGGRYQTAGQL